VSVKREGLFNDLRYYWSYSTPPSFDAKDPSLSALAYFPLKVVAAEWSKYIKVMHNCIKQYEYKTDRLPDLAQFDTNLYELQSWRRRSMFSQQKLTTLIDLLGAQDVSGNDNRDPCATLLLQDYKHLLNGVQEAGQRLENMLPVVTSLVQIADARHSFAETANINRLTILALVFVPLSFVSSLFSMNPENTPGSPYFWVYFVVAIPLTALVFLVARFPQNDLGRFWQWVKGKMERRGRSSNEQLERS
jgi:Mg2+ and Co2+ transporter CorA